MGRRPLEPGKFGKITMRGKHPQLGLWRSEASLKQEKVRPKMWRAEVRYHDPDEYRIRVLTAEGETKGAAEESLSAAMRQALETQGSDHDLGGATVARATKLYLQALERGDVDVSLTTARVYASMIRAHMLGPKSIIGKVPLHRLTALQIEREAARIAAAGAHTQLQNWRAVLNAVLARAVKARGISSNPMRDVVMPKAPRQKKTATYSNGSGRRLNQALTEAEDARLMDRLKLERELPGDLVRVMRYQGLRIGEATSLRLEDVDLDAGTVTVAGKVVRVRGEGRRWDPSLKSSLSYRTIPIREGAREALERRVRACEGRGDTKYIFAPPTSVWPEKDVYSRQLRGIFDRADLKDVTSHTLRRTVEKELELAGAIVSERETFMGHTERVARMHYADHGAVRPSIIEAMDQTEPKSGVPLDQDLPQPVA